MLPRALAKKSRRPAVAPVESPVASTSQASLDEGEHSNSVALTEEQISNLVFDVESALSDYGLYRLPELGRRIRSSADGRSVHLTVVALLPQLAKYQVTVPMLKHALENGPCSSIQLDASNNVVQRMHAPAADFETADWPARCFYAENLPPLSYDATTLAEAREFLSAALNTRIQTIHFPPPPTSTQIQQPAASELSKQVFPKERQSDDLEKHKDVASKLPAGGGRYKRYLFCVVGDAEAAEHARRDWSWLRPKGADKGALDLHKDSGSEDGDAQPLKEEESGVSPAQLASLHGLRLLPLADWRRLRQEYQDWYEKLQQIIEAEPASDDKYPSVDSTAEKGRSDGDWRAARDEIFAETQARETADFPKDCVVFLRNVNPRATRGTLRSLAQAIIGDQGEVSFVTYEKGMGSAHIRCSEASAAAALATYFGDQQLVMVDPASDSPTKLIAADNPEAWEVTFDSLEAEILSGRKESMYWADVPVNARFPKNKSNPQGQSKRKRARQDPDVQVDTASMQTNDSSNGANEETQDAQDASKHLRFD